jgi:hypothetical protein
MRIAVGVFGVFGVFGALRFARRLIPVRMRGMVVSISRVAFFIANLVVVVAESHTNTSRDRGQALEGHGQCDDEGNEADQVPGHAHAILA